MISGHPKSIRIPDVDGLLTGPPDLGRHKEYVFTPIDFIYMH